MFDNFVKYMSLRDTGTEQLIKDTAKRIFFAEGKIHATTQDIADAANISRTSLHYYYRSRDKLMKQVFNEAMSDMDERLYQTMEAAIPFREKIATLIDLFISETIVYPYQEIFLITEMLANDSDVFALAQKGNPRMKRFLKEIEAAMDAGEVSIMSPVQFMMNIIALSAHPLLMSPLHQSLFKLSDKQYERLMIERKKIIVELIFK